MAFPSATRTEPDFMDCSRADQLTREVWKTDRHIVDVLIEERAEHLRARPLLWSLITRMIYPILKYDEARALTEHCAEMESLELFEYFREMLNLRLEISGLQHVPQAGRAVLVANHPSGIADGFAVYEALSKVRKDICFLANRDAIRIVPKLDEMLIPVEWVIEKRDTTKTREMLKAIKGAFEAEKLVVIFPSGRLAKPTVRGLVERAWLPTTINIARRNKAPIIPLHMAGRNSALYYMLYFINEELKNMTLFREMVNKVGSSYRLNFAPPIDPGMLDPDPAKAIGDLRAFVESRFRNAPG